MDRDIRELPVLIIVGKGRSGTTMLQAMLDAHPNLQAPFEARFFLLFRKRYRGRNTVWDEAAVDRLLEDLSLDPKIRLFWDLDEVLLRKLLLGLPAPNDISDLLRAIYLSAVSPFPKEEIALLCDKNPIHTFYLEELLALFPKAKCLHLVRDYRANVNSVRKYAPQIDPRHVARKWKHMNELVEAQKAQFPDRFHTLRYEDLIEDPAGHLEAICKFAGLPYHANMAKYYEVLPAFVEQYVNGAKSEEAKAHRQKTLSTMHANVSSAPNPALAHGWRKNLKESEIIAAEAICGKYGERYGYQREHVHTAADHSSFGVRLRYALKDLKRTVYFDMPHRFRKHFFKPKMPN